MTPHVLHLSAYRLEPNASWLEAEHWDTGKPVLLALDPTKSRTPLLSIPRHASHQLSQPPLQLFEPDAFSRSGDFIISTKSTIRNTGSAILSSHRLEPNASRLEAEDWDTGQPVLLPLDPTKSPTPVLLSQTQH
jgi:hypothetical protein